MNVEFLRLALDLAFNPLVEPARPGAVEPADGFDGMTADEIYDWLLGQ